MTDTANAPPCLRCGGSMRYEGRVSLPPQIIYRCGSCGNDLWVPRNAPHVPPPRPATPPAEPPQVQQQQQQQAQPEPPEAED